MEQASRARAYNCNWQISSPRPRSCLLQSVALQRISSRPALQSVAIGYALSLTSRMDGAGCLSQSDALVASASPRLFIFLEFFFGRAWSDCRRTARKSFHRAQFALSAWRSAALVMRARDCRRERTQQLSPCRVQHRCHHACSAQSVREPREFDGGLRND
jgi:hypothetical protein